MSITDRIVQDLKVAMKAGDKERVGVLRMLRARIQEKEVALRDTKGLDHRLDDDETIEALSAYAKQRRDSIESYRAAGREDLASREEAELAVVREYLPPELSEDEVRRIVAEAVAESGASSPRDLGKVMKLAMPRVKGAADGKQVNRIARELLGG